uniref:Piezo-type mechanosensitive ion channel component n=1 Tax=Acrobeloides nanus TaxID=290746 RepID=A0A914C7C0_9BILA
MVALVVKRIFCWIILPTCLFTAALIRPSFLSLIYVLLGLLAPCLPRIQSSFPVSATIKTYLLLCVSLSLVAAVAQLIYQIIEHAGNKESAYDCENSLNFWLRQIGFSRFPTTVGLRAITVILPEIIALFGSVVTFIVCMAIPSPEVVETVLQNEIIQEVQHTSTSRMNSRDREIAMKKFELSNVIKPGLKRLSDILLMLFVVITGIVQPSLLNAVYFLVFLLVITWWALYTPLKRDTFNLIKKLLILYSAAHFIILYLYQIPVFQDLVDPQNFGARFVGLTPLMEFKCPNYWVFFAPEKQSWTYYVNFIFVFVLYHILILQFRWTRMGIRYGCETVYSEDSSVHQELLGPDFEDGTENVQMQPIQHVTSAVLDRQKIAIIFHRPGAHGTFASKTMTDIMYFILHHCYVFALLAMMLWALVYHSIFGLIFLVLPCILWSIPNSRKWSFQLSPLLVAFAEFLLVAQYIFSMDLNELPTSSTWIIIGFIKTNSSSESIIILCIKVALSLPLFVLLRLHLREKFYDSLSEHDLRKQLNYGTFTSPRAGRSTSGVSENANDGTHFMELLTRYFTKFWIFIVGLVLLINVFDHPTFIVIGYFLFWSVFLLNLHLSFRFFRAFIYLYWTLLISYTSIVIIAVFIFQFTKVEEYWRDLTGLSQQWDCDIGIFKYESTRVCGSAPGDSSTLFWKLIKRIALLIVIVLQMKIFHDPWTRLTNAQSQQSLPQHDPEPTAARSAYHKARSFLIILIEILWRFAEVHFYKLILLILMVIAVHHVCAINFVLVLFVILTICLQNVTGLISFLLTIYLSVDVVARFVYQLNFMKNITSEHEITPKEDCSEDLGLQNNTQPQSFTQWIGFNEFYSNVDNDILGLISVMVLIAIYWTIRYRQSHIRKLFGKSEPPSGIIFPEAEPSRYDASLLDCIKFFFNYGFYKFGFECSLIITFGYLANLVFYSATWRKSDSLAFLYNLSSYSIAFDLCHACGIASSFMSILPLVYVDSRFNLVTPRLRFSKQTTEDGSGFLIYDFFLLLMVASQERVFRKEKVNHPAGDNDSIYKNGKYNLRRDNPHHDFIVHQTSFVDYFKIAIFMYGHWVTLITVFAAGLGGTSLFALGYLVLAFWMLWQGNNLYTMKKYRRTLSRWNFLLFYNVATIFFKVALQVMGCVFVYYIEGHGLCYLRQLFSIECVNSLSRQSADSIISTDEKPYKDKCIMGENSYREASIGYDVLAFAFLIFQFRILHSWYFQHCMIDFRCEVTQSNRGAVLVNQLIEKEMKEQNAQQQEKLDEIKNRATTIRKRHEEMIRRSGGVEAYTPGTYGHAKRAGDYYMFDYDPHDDNLGRPVESFVPEVTPGAGDFDKLDPIQLMHTAIQHDLDLPGTLNAVETAEKIKDEQERMQKAVEPESLHLDETQPETDATQAEEEGKPFSDKVYNWLKFAGKIFRAGLEFTAAFLNRRSREHRYVAYVLNKEKERLKLEMNVELYDASQPMRELRSQWEERNIHSVSSESDVQRLESEAYESWEQRNVFAKFMIAAGNCIAAHTDILCYFLAIVAHATCCGLITLPLPMLVFFWGTLASPRPSRIFWIVMIAYTEIVILIKFIFQFGFFPWNNPGTEAKGQNDTFKLDYLFGIQKVDFFAVWDVALLIGLFFHRYNLRRLGLWKDANSLETFEAPITSTTSAGSTQENVAAIATDEVQLQQIGDGEPTQNGTNNPQTIPKSQRGPIVSFVYKLFNPRFRYIRDLYPLMFFIDLFCLIFVALNFSSFGEGGSGDVLSDIQSNKVPLTFVIILLVITLMIVIDRALYLRKAVLSKLIYQVLVILILHAWIFYILPLTTKTRAVSNSTAKFLYIVKCVYLIVSAWQIRNGYPTLCVGNLLTHSYGLFNMVAFKIFMLIPFLFELRTAIDWTWTDTSMPLFDFFSMENFYATIYNIKCARQFEMSYPAPRGQPKGKFVKYFMGIPFVLALIFIIWAPILAYALLNRIGSENTPVKASISFSINGYPPLYVMEAQGVELTNLNDHELNKMTDNITRLVDDSSMVNEVWRIDKARQALSFLGDYQLKDILKVQFRPVSETWWPISGDSFDALQNQLNSNGTITISIDLSFERPRLNSKTDPKVHTTSIQVPIDNSTIDALKSVVKNIKGTVEFKYALPYFVGIPNEGEIISLDFFSDLVKPFSDNKTNTGYSTLSLNPINTTQDKLAWIASQNLSVGNLSQIALDPKDVPYDLTTTKRQYIQMVAFVDRVFPGFLSKFAQGGIIAMYGAVVILVAGKLRGVFTNSPLDCIIQEIPTADHLMKICLDIYICREAKDFVLEQDIFAKLIFLFRSPATLIKWTRLKPKTD